MLVDRTAEGTLVAVDDDHLALRTAGADRARRIPLSSIERVRMAAGSRPATWRGAFLGTAVGLIAAIAWDEATGERTEKGLLADPRWGLRAGIVAGGAGLGALIGHRVRVPDWRRVVPR